MQKTLLFWEIIYECKKAMHPRDPDHKGILVQRKRGVMGVRNWTSFRKRFHIREKKSCWFWSYLLKIWTNSRPPIPPRTISWSYNYYLIFYSKYERMHIAYRYKIKYKLAFSSKFSEAATGGGSPNTFGLATLTYTLVCFSLSIPSILCSKN